MSRNVQHIAKGGRIRAEIADEPEIARVECRAEMQAEAGVAGGRRSVLKQRNVGGERDARPLAAQRVRVQPGSGQHRLHR